MKNRLKACENKRVGSNHQRLTVPFEVLKKAFTVLVKDRVVSFRDFTRDLGDRQETIQ